MAHRVAEDVDLELDDIWLYVAKQSSSIDIADHVVDSITALPSWREGPLNLLFRGRGSFSTPEPVRYSGINP